MSRPASCLYRACRSCVQADESCGRLLARRFKPANATTYLRHRLAGEKDLKNYLNMLEEAEKRDHRKLGRQLDFFHLQEEAAGSVFWHPRGWTLYREIEEYMRQRLDAANITRLKPRN